MALSIFPEGIRTKSLMGAAQASFVDGRGESDNANRHEERAESLLRGRIGMHSKECEARPGPYLRLMQYSLSFDLSTLEHAKRAGNDLIARQKDSEKIGTSCARPE